MSFILLLVCLSLRGGDHTTYVYVCGDKKIRPEDVHGRRGKVLVGEYNSSSRREHAAGCDGCDVMKRDRLLQRLAGCDYSTEGS